MYCEMKAISRRTLLIFVLLASGRSEPCTEYGCPGRPHYEPFVPAPPGHTPSCAKPGQTFCESLDHYPQQLIKFLVDKCSFDFSTALRDESHEDFHIYKSPPTEYHHEGYDYPRQDVPASYPQALPFLPTHYPLGRQPALTYGPPFNGTHRHGYKYATPPTTSQSNTFLMATGAAATASTKYHQILQQQYFERPIHAQTQFTKLLKREQTLWGNNRYIGNNQVAPRSPRNNPLLEYANLKGRTKRQAANPNSIALCPTESQYITPRAALNNQGNWMYVVNLENQDDKYSQVVKSEKCSTTTCNGLCSVPAGYTSSCQQQYVQKRLVALEGSGNRLYTDVFWFPHGCSCHVTLNY